MSRYEFKAQYIAAAQLPVRFSVYTGELRGLVDAFLRRLYSA